MVSALNEGFCPALNFSNDHINRHHIEWVLGGENSNIYYKILEASIILSCKNDVEHKGQLFLNTLKEHTTQKNNTNSSRAVSADPKVELWVPTSLGALHANFSGRGHDAYCPPLNLDQNCSNTHE